MSLAASRVIAHRAIARNPPAQFQKRGIVDYLTNYPNKVRGFLAPAVLLVDCILHPPNTVIPPEVKPRLSHLSLRLSPLRLGA